ncbi:MAG: hypothetical protein O7D34_03755, partial [Ignavibacteria bacterium]|nr:hypothetical protein [Ignavibacteria bacterium]
MNLFLRRAKPDPLDVAFKKGRELRVRIALCLLSGVMLGFSFPPSSLGVLACFGLVPLLIVLADIDEIGLSLRYSYVALFVFHLITLNWTGGYSHGKDGYMMIAGAVTMIVHPLFYFIPLFAYLFVRKHFGHRVSLIAFPFLWVGYEYTHSLSEWSFPWITIGNSQSYDIAQMQFISSTGVYGLSLWILVVNVLVFVLYSKLAQRVWQPLSRTSLSFLVVILFVFFLPKIQGMLILSKAPPYADPISEGENRVTVGMIQSNIDPWEKWK